VRSEALIRTLQIAERLRGGRRTLESLAREFGVNTRTVRRDIEALELAGVMVRTSRFEGLPGVYWWIVTTRERELRSEAADTPVAASPAGVPS
jgi:predicted DNA-binding transcriptional regulator YafY